MSKADYIRRKYAKLVTDDIHQRLPDLLLKLKVINMVTWNFSVGRMSDNYYNVIQRIRRQERKVEQRHSLRPPKIIKPRGTVR